MFARSRTFLLAGCVLFAWALRSPAQMHHVDAPERVTRAVGVYEWTGDLSKPTAARFVPVSLFIDGHFEDAGVYLARPIPFALQSGDLYTVEHSGEPQGILDLQMAEHVVTGNALADDNPAGVWYGFGKFTVEAAPKAPPALHKSAHVGVIQSTSDTGKAGAKGEATANTDDGRPHVSRRDGGGSTGTSTDAGSASGSANGSGSGAATPASSGSKSGSDDDTDRPTLARRDPSQDAARRRTAVSGKAGTASVIAVGPAPGDDPDRPTLGRSSGAVDGPKELTGMPADLHQAVAVSDPVDRDPHPFARPWEDAPERAATLAAMEALARPRVAAYLVANRLVPSAEMIAIAKPSANTEGVAADTENGAGEPPKLQRGKPAEYATETSSTMAKTGAGTKAADAVKPAPLARTTARARATGHTAARPATASPLVLRDAQIAGYVLSYGGLPTFVYTAAAAAAPAEPKESASAAAHVTAFVTLVAQRLPSGELQVALGAVTDSQHLDRSPRLHLIDAVDPDASHRASLLFELRGANSRQFALYRLTSARAENMFTSASIE